MTKALHSILIVVLATYSNLTLGAQSIRLPQDHYVDRLRFINDSIVMCQKVVAGQWKLNRGEELNREQLHFVRQMTGSDVLSSSIILGSNNIGIGSLSVDLSQTQSKAAYFNFNYDEEYFKIALQHDEYVSEGIAKIFLTPQCKLSRANLSFFDRNEGLVMRLWMNEKFQITRKLVAKAPIQGYEQVTGRSSRELQREQNQFKVLVGIIDQGVDYNHPKLIGKMRPNQDTLNSLNSMRKESQNSKQGWLDRWILQITNPEWIRTSEANRRKIQYEIRKRVEEEKTVGRDFTTNDSLPFDYASSNISETLNEMDNSMTFDHGTHVADIASRSSAIRLLPLRVANRSKKAGEAVEYAYQRGVRIINVSMGSFDKVEWTSFQQAVQRHRDVLFVVAAGNEKNDLSVTPSYPAAFSEPNMIVVASVDPDNKLSDFSNYDSGGRVHIAAIGRNVLAAIPHGQEGEKSGTSMATPQVTRTAARMFALNPELKPTDIIRLLMTTARKVKGLEGKVVSGVLNENAAINAAKSVNGKP